MRAHFRYAECEKTAASLLCRCAEKNLTAITESVIVVADDLYPSETVSLDREHVLGIITQVGVETSHTAIIEKSYEILRFWA